MKISRRSFLAGSVAALGATLVSCNRTRSPNATIRVVIVGVHGKGQEHVRMFAEIPNVQVAGLCDCDQDVLNKAAASFEKDHPGQKPTRYTDLRRVLDDHSIDAVVIATPNHWHALATIWACQAGKDVYVEKPASHCIWEGRKMVEAARKYRRIVQVGTQSRSDKGFPEMLAWLQEGHLGKVLHARALCYKRRESIGKVGGPQPIPAAVDYDLWCGPAPRDPLLRRKLHYDWHWFWTTGNGDIGNQAPHEIDLCRWALGQNQLPPRVLSFGGRVGYVDDGQTPNTQVAILAYEPAPLIVEVRGLPKQPDDDTMDHYRGVRVGVVIQCEGGYYAGGGGGGWTYDNQGERIQQFTHRGPKEHQANFIDAVRSRKPADLHADVLEGHLSASLAHLANISYSLGQACTLNKLRDDISTEPLLAEALDRMEKHLEANEVDLDATPLFTGRALQVAPQFERFIGPGADQANGFLRREYREPFAIRDNV